MPVERARGHGTGAICGSLLWVSIPLSLSVCEPFVGPRRARLVVSIRRLRSRPLGAHCRFGIEPCCRSCEAYPARVRPCAGGDRTCIARLGRGRRERVRLGRTGVGGGCVRAYPARVRPCARGMPRRFRPAWSTPRVRAPAPACGRGSARVQGASKRNESRLFRHLRWVPVQAALVFVPRSVLGFRSVLPKSAECERPLTFCRRLRRRPGPENRPGAGGGQNRAAGPVLGRKRPTILRLRTFGI